MKRRSLQKLALLVALASLSTSCSTVRRTRTGRVGWLEAPASRFPATVRSPAAKSASSSPVRKGILQMPEAPSARAGRYDHPDLQAVREAHWTRIARSVRLTWPLQRVEVTSRFGERDGDPHEGIDLRASTGTPVLAAHDGVVLYSGSGIGGYGRLVVIKNGQGISTVYGHNSRLLVRKGQRVRRGQRIALSGSTGRSSGPHVHFEVRLGVRAVDPLLLIALPRAQTAQVLSSRRRSTLAASQRLR